MAAIACCFSSRGFCKLKFEKDMHTIRYGELAKFMGFVALCFFGFGNVSAQTDADLLRYSMVNPIGTARYNAMGGAFGALGANFASLSTNPAGIGFYTRHEVSVTLGGLAGKGVSDYYGERTSVDGERFLVPQGGGVLCVRQSGAVKLQAAFGANRLKDFNNNAYSRGVNDQSSYMEYVAAQSAGYDFAAGDRYSAHLGNLAYQTGLMDYSDTTDFLYNSLLGPGMGLEQRHVLREYGNITEMVFSFGGNWAEKLYFGATLGIPVVDYRQESVAGESSDEVLEFRPGDIRFKSYEFSQDMDVSGTGINLKLGLIYKPAHFFRVGVAFHTPTHYWLRERTTVQVNTDMDYPLDDGTSLPNQSSYGYEDRYEVITPAKGILSLGFLIKNFGAIGIEGELTDYRKMRLDVGDWDYENSLQSLVDENYRLSGVVRFGTEWRVSILSFRAGYIWQSCPYANQALRDNWYDHTATFGLGLTLGRWNLDFGFMANYGKRTDDFYYLTDQYGAPLVSPASLKLSKYAYTFSLGCRF